MRSEYKRRSAFALAALLITRAQIGTTAARIQRQNTNSASLRKPQHRLISLKGGRTEAQSAVMIDFLSKTHTYTHTKKRARARIRKRNGWKPSRGRCGLRLPKTPTLWIAPRRADNWRTPPAAAAAQRTPTACKWK